MGGGTIWRGRTKAKRAERLRPSERVIEVRRTKLLHRGELYEQLVEFRQGKDGCITIHLDGVYQANWTMSQEAGEQVLDLFQRAAWGRDERR